VTNQIALLLTTRFYAEFHHALLQHAYKAAKNAELNFKDLENGQADHAQPGCPL